MNFDIYDAAKTAFVLLLGVIGHFVKKLHNNYEALKTDFVAHQLHVSDHYVKKEDLRRLEDKMDEGFERVIARINTLTDLKK